ncbi:C-C motif chemokine 34b.8 isoform X1 [Onychostoma macrolepis]|uniref:C-C motif chemokine 34b.8 isoform X1 n=1 Tax=Onychostoma macrolepis TaxID=369639 RepID=UPI00272AC40D|nr:C-C motif chemokine 34b.8 isoform X1 [Onychostoma macrolepis]
MWVALRISVTVPVTVAAAERSFSKLKLIQTYLRSTMAQERLSELGVISINNDVSQKLSFDAVIDEIQACSVISHDPKKPTCCRKLTNKEPVVKITSCYILPATRKCLAAVVFLDKNNRLHCINPEAPWLSERIKRLEQNGVTCEDYTKSKDKDMVAKHV